jgi:hypothetical protein
MTIGLTWRRTARRIKRLNDCISTIPPDYVALPAPPDFLVDSNSNEGKMHRKRHVAFSPVQCGVLILAVKARPLRRAEEPQP